MQGVQQLFPQALGKPFPADGTEIPAGAASGPAPARPRRVSVGGFALLRRPPAAVEPGEGAGVFCVWHCSARGKETGVTAGAPCSGVILGLG